MVYLSYFDKAERNGDTLQFPYHRDNTYNKHGDFMHNLNSQERHTATFALTIGDPRNLCFKRCRYDYVEEREVEIEGSHESETLTHGSLFVLHPRDEEPFLRTNFDTNVKSYFKHGNVLFGSNGLSIGLVFRATSPKFAKQVYKHSGELVLDNQMEAESKYSLYIDVLDEYLADEEHKKYDDNKYKKLYLELKEKYFNCISTSK